VARRGDFAEALVRYREAERWHPDAPGLARNLGLAAFESGDYAASARALARAVEAEPGDRAARALLAVSLASTERWAEAAEAFAAIGEGAYSDPRLAFLWARSLARSGRPEEARRVLARMRGLPLPPEALAQVAALYEELGDRETAAELEAEAARRRARP
jgi:pentatricopeptide repeat protein